MRMVGIEDVDQVNQILNHPSVRPYVFEGDHPLDFRGNIGITPAYLEDGGVLIAEAVGMGDYLALSAFLPEARGFHSVAAHRKALDIHFTTTDCRRVFAVVQKPNERAIRNLLALGFRFDDCEGDRLRFVKDWINWAKYSGEARRQSKGLLHMADPDHPEEAIMLAAFCMTVRGGWSGKALAGFNQWASFAARPGIVPVHQDEETFVYKTRFLLEPFKVSE